MNCEDVSFESLTASRSLRTKQTGAPGETYLILNDTTEINYGGQRKTRGLGLVARNKGQGFFLHSALMRVETLVKVRQRSGWRAKTLNAGTMTIEEFVKQLGGLGGHLGRKSDGRPGWQTLWRGLEKLLLILRGLQATQQKCG